MRCIVLAGLTYLASAAAVGADAPVPQDTAQMEKRSRERLEWNGRLLEGAYDRVGKKDPRWDKPAREALGLAARVFSRQYDPIVWAHEPNIPAKQAIDAGCDDPLILYLYFRSSVGKAYPGQAEYARRAQVAAEAMSASTYPPIRRAVAMSFAAELKAWKEKLTPEERREVERELDATLDILPASVAEDARNEDWEDVWYATINAVIAAYQHLSGDYKAAFDRVDGKLAKFAGIEALRLVLKGNFQIEWGWQARTSAVAAAVTDEQFRTFDARLRDARTALEGAWKAKPDEPHVAALMLTVEKAIGEGDRQAMESWFERAMKADGNDQEACWAKLDWLDPKWHGGDSPEEMLAFGKACGATKNWHTGITLLAADAHLRHCSRLDHAEKTMYMKFPEVWTEIQSVYDEYLNHYPDDDVQRSKHAMLAYLGAHYAEAHIQFQAVGDRLTTWPAFPNLPLQTMKDARDHTARIITARQRGRDAPPKNDDTAKPDPKPDTLSPKS